MKKDDKEHTIFAIRLTKDRYSLGRQLYQLAGLFVMLALFFGSLALIQWVSCRRAQDFSACFANSQFFNDEADPDSPVRSRRPDASRSR